MSLHYQSGEKILKDDFVLFHGKSGRIELVAEVLGDPETDWYVEEHGGGVMVVEAVAGRTFIPADQLADTEDLEFVSRADEPTQ